MPINSKQKGSRAERELSKILNSYGLETRRSQQYCGNVEDGSPDLVGMKGIHVESKWVEKMNIFNAMHQAERDVEIRKSDDLPVVFHKRNREPWIVALNLDDFMKLYLEWVKTL